MLRVIFLLVVAVFSVLCRVAAATPTIQYSQGKHRMLNCRIDAQSLEDCDPDGYRILVWMHAGPGIIVATVVFLVTVAYCMGKYICDCCGGRRQSPNFCCPMRGFPAMYSKGDLMRPFFLSVLVLLISIGACTWGCISVGHFNHNIKEMRDSVDLSIKKLFLDSIDFLSNTSISAYDSHEDTVKVLSLLDALPHRDVFEKAFLSRSTMVSNLTENIILSDPTMAETFSRLFYAICILSTVLSAVGFVFALCNYRRYLSMLVFFFMAFFAVLVWLTNGLFSATAFNMEKTCLEISEFTHRRVNVLGVLSDCDDDVMQSHFVDMEDAFVQRARIVCGKIKPFCYEPSQTVENNIKLKQVLSCPLSMNCATATDDDLSTWIRTSMRTASEILNNDAAKEEAKQSGYLCALTGDELCDSKACSTECTINGKLSFVGKACKEFHSSVFSLVSARTAFDTVGRQLGNCNAVLDTVILPLYDPCSEAVGASAGMLQSSGLLALTLIAAMFAYSIGAKRFIPFYKAQTPQFN